MCKVLVKKPLREHADAATQTEAFACSAAATIPKPSPTSSLDSAENENVRSPANEQYDSRPGQSDEELDSSQSEGDELEEDEFENNDVDIYEATKTKSHSAQRMQGFWIEMRQLKGHIREINSIQDCSQDPRPFVAVLVLQRLVKGLLDPGAAVSCLRGSLAQQFLEDCTPFKKIYSKVSTADGNREEIVGKVCLPVVYD